MDDVSPESAPAPRVVTLHLFGSDFHLSLGIQPDGDWHTLEDFRSDDEFAHMLDLTQADYPPEVVIVLHLVGDVFDFMAMAIKGKHRAVPTFQASIEKLRGIMLGHPVFFAAVARFLALRPNAELHVTVGNHDQDLAWPEVQAVLTDALVPKDQSHRVRYMRRERIGQTEVIHGCEYDDLNDIPKDEDMFITDKKGGSILPIAFLTVLLTHGAILPLIAHPGELLSVRTLGLGLIEFLAAMVIIGWAWGKLYFWKWGSTQRFMNYPLPYYVHARLYMILKRYFFPDLGRLQDHGTVWIKTLAKSPYWAPFIFLCLLTDVLVHMFFIDIWSVRRKASLRIYWQLVTMSMHPDEIDKELDRHAHADADLKYVIYGHTHGSGIKTRNVGERTVTFMNLGSWGIMTDMQLPKVDCVTEHPRLEAFFRRISLYLRRAPVAALAIAIVHLGVAVFPTVCERLFGWSFGPFEYLFPPLSLFLLLWRFSYTQFTSRPFHKRTIGMLREFEGGGMDLSLNEYQPPARGEDGHGQFVNAL